MDDIMEENDNQALQSYLYVLGKRIIDEEVQRKLREIVECAVCMEVPKPNKDLKIRTCEQGHHFCPTCYKNLKHCAICRGRLLFSRNFVVEELITQIGSSLGLIRSNLPPPNETPPLVPGMFKCLHMCSSQFCAGFMLNHIRTKHSENLVDNLRSNPYLDRFDWTFKIAFILHKQYILSVQISDMGLFTIIINFSNNCMIGTIHMLANSMVACTFQYKLGIKINKTVCTHEFSISNCDVLDYCYDADAIIASGKCLKIDNMKLLELMDVGETIHIILSICKKKEGTKNGKDDLTTQMVFPEVPIVFHSDRNLQRNRKRNLRRKRIRKNLPVFSKKTAILNLLKELHLE